MEEVYWEERRGRAGYSRENIQTCVMNTCEGEEETWLGDCPKWVSIAAINTITKSNLGRKGFV